MDHRVIWEFHAHRGRVCRVRQSADFQHRRRNFGPARSDIPRRQRSRRSHRFDDLEANLWTARITIKEPESGGVTADDAADDDIDESQGKEELKGVALHEIISFDTDMSSLWQRRKK